MPKPRPLWCRGLWSPSFHFAAQQLGQCLIQEITIISTIFGFDYCDREVSLTHLTSITCRPYFNPANKGSLKPPNFLSKPSFKVTITKLSTQDVLLDYWQIIYFRKSIYFFLVREQRRLFFGTSLTFHIDIYKESLLNEIYIYQRKALICSIATL